MTTLLHISSSPRGEHSESLAIAATFLDELRATHPHVKVEHWDLWDGTLPEFGPPAAAAKMAIFGGADPRAMRPPHGGRATRSSASTPLTPTYSASRCGTRRCPTSSSNSSMSSANPA